MSRNLVRDWMTRKPITISPNTLLREAYWLMMENKVNRLLVVDGDRLVGVVTMNDLRRAEPPTGMGLDLVKITETLSRMTILQIMTPQPRTIVPDATLIDAARLMLEHQISTLPVTEGSNLVGIITESDIFRAFVELGQKE